jgi:hypothetical protein
MNDTTRVSTAPEKARANIPEDNPKRKPNPQQNIHNRRPTLLYAICAHTRRTSRTKTQLLKPTCRERGTPHTNLGVNNEGEERIEPAGFFTMAGDV